MLRKFRARVLGVVATCMTGIASTLSPVVKGTIQGALHPYHMGGCQNYGPLLGPLNTWCRIIIGTHKGSIILTTTHMYYPTVNGRGQSPRKIVHGCGGASGQRRRGIRFVGKQKHGIFRTFMGKRAHANQGLK